MERVVDREMKREKEREKLNEWGKR